MLRKLEIGEPAFSIVEPVFDWASVERSFMPIVDVCRAAGFEPTPGDCVSVSALLRRKGIKRAKHCGQRGALMPPVIARPR